MSKRRPSNNDLAVVGMACWYPGAQTLVEFWENILAKRQQFRRMPDVRLPLDQYQHADKSTPDKTYGTEAAVIDGFEFDWKGRRIPKQVYESTDIVHWLALEVALKALEDSGQDLAKLQTLQTGVVLGNTLTGEWTRTNAMRMRWPYFQRVLEETAAQRGLTGEAFQSYVKTVEEAFKSVFPPVNEDTLAGALSNTIAGRVCNFLDLHGGGYTVDGACSSSLLAVITAARSLVSRDLDVAFAGGIDISLDTFELIGFAKTGALTPEDMRVYDKRANGFIPGEGCGFVVLKRLEDALRDQDRIYAVLKGWGISSDGKGGMTAPAVSGQASAIGKAYAMAGYGIDQCHFIEGHGTGTTVGDKVEITALTEVLGTAVPARPIGLTSLKSIVGHTKAAAGIGAFIKTVIAVNQRVLPPMAGVEEPNILFQDKARHFFPAIDGMKLSHSTIMRAGVSAMGFGGINSHTTLESYGEPSEHLRPLLDDRQILSSHDKAEILVFSAPSQAQLQKKVLQVLSFIRRISRAELVDLAADLSRFTQAQDPYRAAVVAHRPEEAWKALEKLKGWLDAPMPTQKTREQLEGSTYIALGHSSKSPRLGFLFPGQGAQKLNMGRKLQNRYEWARDLAEQADREVRSFRKSGLLDKMTFDPGEDQEARSHTLTATENAQPAISLTNALWFEQLQRLGLAPHAVGGHSLGELSALYAARAFDFATLIRLAAKRGQLMSSPGDKAGTMIHIGADAQTVEGLIKGVSGYAQIANRNAPDQTVVAGDPPALQAILDAAKQKGLRAGPLPVSNAFHSRYMQEAAKSFGTWLEEQTIGTPRLTFIRGTDGQTWQDDQQLATYLSQQIVEQVDFIALTQAMLKQVDLVFEVGPGGILSGLVRRIQNTGAAFSVESRPCHDPDFKIALATVYVHGARIRWDELYRARLVRPFLKPDDKLYIESPTERPLKWTQAAAQSLVFHAAPSSVVGAPQATAVANPTPSPVVAPPGVTPPPTVVPLQVRVANEVASPALAPTSAVAARSEANVEQVLARIIEELTGFEAATITPSMRVLDDLNMDSIKASELVANAAMHFGIAGELEAVTFANATIGEIAEAIRSKLAESSPKSRPEAPARPAVQAAAPVIEVASKPAAPAAVAPAAVAPAAVAPAPAAKVVKIAESTRLKNMTPWVRNFTEVFTPRSRAPAPDLSRWGTQKVLVLCQAREGWRWQAFAQFVMQYGANVQLELAEAGSQQRWDATGRDCTIIIAPQPTADSASDLKEHVLLLAGVGQSKWPRGHRITFIQFDDGQFGHSSGSNAIASYKAFAQSLAHERPDLKVASLSIASSFRDNDNWLASQLSAELAEDGSSLVSAYSEDGQIQQAQWLLDHPGQYASRGISWSKDDVVLVTGGAKGITAACALAAAKDLGVKMALIGSSPLSDADSNNPEHPIGATLTQFAQAGLTARYFSCDISKEAAVRSLLETIQKEMGQPRALIHGAGMNTPKPVISVTAEDAAKEMAPKLQGIRNFLAAMDPEPLKLIVGLTSVIGVVGMPGNAWYGFANESLDLLLRRYASRHPHVQCQTLAYSVWAEVGMGARMGSDKNLADKGISPIVPEEGIQRFLALVKGKSRDQQTIITSRMGSIGGQERRTKSGAIYSISFADNLLHHQPDVEVIARCHLTLDGHPYLKDHNYKGAYLMPTVYGLEAMAQVVDRLEPLAKRESLRLENIQLTRPITVGPQGCDIEIYAQRLESPRADSPVRIRAGIRTALTGFKYDHFAADYVFEACAQQKVGVIPDYGKTLTVDPHRQLYGSILFQGPMFQRLQALHHLESDNETEGCTVFTSQAKSEDLSGHILGDPFFRDSLLQSAQIIIPQNQCLPIEIARLELYRNYNRNPKRTCFTDVHKADAKTYLATITVFDADGQILERMVDYRLQFLEKRPSLPKAMDLVQAGTMPAAVETAKQTPAQAVQSAPVNGGEDLLAPYHAIAERLKIDAEPNGPQGQSVFVHRFIPDFKAFANLSRSIYFANFFNWMGNARELSSLPVLSELRALTETGRWGQVTNWASIEVLGECRNKDRVVEARLWCGRVTGSKNSSATLCFDWVSKGENGIEERIAIGHMGFTWVEILDHGIVAPAEFPESYRDFIASMIARDDRKDTYIPAREPYRSLEKGETLFKVPEGPKTSIRLVEKIFETSLYDANLVGNLYFGNYSIWMGKIRDYYFQGLVPEMYRGIGEQGELICVKSRIQHLREAMPFDDILVTMGLKGLHQHGVDLYFEYYKVTADGHSEKLAIADHTALWTKRGADGEKVAVPWPEKILTALWERIHSVNKEQDTDKKKVGA